jgi:hypothetical protein
MQCAAHDDENRSDPSLLVSVRHQAAESRCNDRRSDILSLHVLHVIALSALRLFPIAHLDDTVRPR